MTARAKVGFLVAALAFANLAIYGAKALLS